ncbi:MAG TPA: hypothetical protein VIO64_12775, partial [Pseudobacteroides sp.]|uniref:hypothetical protein n=1 Tax=Pseudobacteroides sp. TaxID=1968840 RepID=UPI002F946129
SEFFNKKDTSLQKDLIEFKENLFLPSRVIVSESFHTNSWIIDKNDTSFFPKLYADMKLYLADILTKAEIRSNKVSPLTEEIVLKFMETPFVAFEFSTSINSSMLPWLLDFSGVNIINKEISGIKKVIIVPNLTNEEDSCSIKIIDEIGKKVFQYSLSFKGNTGKKWYQGMIGELNRKNSPYSKYSMVNEGISSASNNIIGIPRDMLLLVPQSSKFSTFKNYSCKSPDEFIIPELDRQNKNEDIISQRKKELAQKVLKSEADSFLSSVDVNSATFRNVGNTYKVHDSGLLEYHYLQTEGNVNKGGLDEAFEKVTEFIGSKLDLVIKPETIDSQHSEPELEIYFSGLVEERDRYRFTFDYRLDGTPVYFYSQNKENNKHTSAIIIEATDKRVLDCEWIIKEFIHRGDKEYNLLFADLKDSLSQVRPDIESIKDVHPCYEVQLDANIQELKPLWLMITEKKERFIQKMVPK